MRLIRAGMRESTDEEAILVTHRWFYREVLKTALAREPAHPNHLIRGRTRS